MSTDTKKVIYGGDHHFGPARGMRRWAEGGIEWHQHTITHVHAGGDVEHTHIVTDEGTATALDRLLGRVVEGNLAPGDHELASKLRDLLIA